MELKNTVFNLADDGWVVGQFGSPPRSLRVFLSAFSAVSVFNSL
jgi:hypothetical protein